MSTAPDPILFERPLRSLGLAVGLHLALLVLTMLSPYLWHYRPKLPEIHTVNLFNVQEIAAPAPRAAAPAAAPVSAPTPAPTPPPPPAAIPEPPAAKPVVTPQESKKVAETAPAPTPPTAISTRPIQVKTKKDVEQLRRLQESLQAGEKAKAAAKEAEAAARAAAREKDRAAREAVAALRQSYQTRGPSRTGAGSGPANATGSAAGGPVTVDAATRAYLIAVNNRIQAHWALPDLPSWNKDLLAIIIVTVRRDGSVAKSAFEQRSENLYFNQLVQKTIQDASPMPPFPPDLRQPEMEIGLRFRPGEVF